MKDTRYKGLIAELKVMERATEKGWIASRPMISARYDLILDDQKQLWKIQVKYADGHKQNVAGSVVVELARRRQGYKKNEIDAIIVYLPVIETLCWLPLEVFDRHLRISIRHTPAKNNQVARCIMASDYFW